MPSGEVGGNRVERALAGEIGSETLTGEEAKLFDAEVDARIRERLSQTDLTLPEHQSIEPISNVSTGPNGEAVLTTSDGTVYNSKGLPPKEAVIDES